MEIKIQLCNKDTVRPVTLYTTCSIEVPGELFKANRVIALGAQLWIL